MAKCECFTCSVAVLITKELKAYRDNPKTRDEPPGAATAHVMGMMWGLLDVMLKNTFTPDQQIEFAEAYSEEFVKIVKARLADSVPPPSETRH